MGSKNVLGYISVFAEYLHIRCPKIRTKNFKNCILILAIVNYRNWLHASPPKNVSFNFFS